MDTKVAATELRGIGSLLWISICLLAVTVNAYGFEQGRDLRFQRLQEGTEAIKNHASALTSITQDRTGFMWFGGENGLSRFDGVRFKRYEQNHLSGSLPSNHVRDLATDAQGVMWVATDRGLCRYHPQTDRFDVFTPDHTVANSLPHNVVTSIAVDKYNNLVLGTGSGISILPSDRAGFINHPLGADSKNPTFVYAAFVDSKNRIWVGSRDSGLYLLSANGEVIRRFRADPNDPTALQSDTVKAVEEDQFGRIWVGTYGGGVSRINEGERDFTHYGHDPLRPGSIGSNTISDIYLDSDDHLWISTDQGGLALYQPQTDTFRHFRASMHDRFTLASNQVRTIFEDRDQNLWIASFPNGINFFDRGHSQVTNYTHKPGDLNSLSNSAVLNFLKTADGILWIGTEKGLNQFAIDSRRFIGRYTRDASDPGSLRANSVLSLEEDFNGEIWVGTWSGGLHRLNRITQNFSHYGPNQADAGYINSAFIWDLFLDSENTLWVGTENGGLNRYDRKADKFTAFVHDPNDPNSIASNFVWAVMEDSRGQLWIATADGLDILDRQKGIFRHMSDPLGGPKTITSVRTRSLFEDRKGRVWIGTQDLGPFVFDPQAETFSHVPWPKSLSPLVTSFLEDNLDYIWASTANGIARIDPDTFAVRSFHKSHGLVGDNFNRNATFKDQDGLLYFGGTDGFSVFDPRAFAGEEGDYPLVLTDFKLLNRSVVVGEESPLQKAITYADRIRLQHDDSMFSFDFSVLNYHSPYEHRYAYKLEGFDQQWHEVAAEHNATYTNIDPGEYIFKVRSSDRDGVWSRHNAQVAVVVSAPPWRSPFAIIVYGLLLLIFAALLIGAVRKYIERTVKNTAEDQRLQGERNQQLIFSSSVRQLQGPLNIISQLAEEILQDSQSAETDGDPIRPALIIANGRYINNLINNLLDYEKLFVRDFPVHIEAVDLYTQTDACLKALQPLLLDQSVTLTNNLRPDCPKVAVDILHLQRVLVTLFYRAINASKDGEFTICATEEKQGLQITLCSSGDMDVTALLEPFPEEHMDVGQYEFIICKRLLEANGGDISVVRSANERPPATCLLLNLPLATPQPPVAANIIDAGNSRSSEFPPKAKLTGKLAAPLHAEQFQVLIVDDDPVNRMVLTGILGLHHYTVLEAGSGAEALNMVWQNGQPVDLVILDIMMPRMSGLEVCARLRKYYDENELPIVFLTARHAEEDVRKGLEVGGNEVLYKPVNKDVLLPRVKFYLRAGADHRKRQKTKP